MDFPPADSSNGFSWTTSPTPCVNEFHCLSVSCSSWAVINRGTITPYLNSPSHHPTICQRPYVICLFRHTFSKLNSCPSLPSLLHYQALNELQEANIAWGIQDKTQLHCRCIQTVFDLYPVPVERRKKKKKERKGSTALEVWLWIKAAFELLT